MNVRDLLNIRLEAPEINKISNLGLAHLGDAVFELMVRTYLCAEGVLTSKNLHRKTISLVSAAAQSDAAKRIMDMLDEEEKGVFLRGRNTRVNSVPQNAKRDEYQNATALETLFGYIYLKGGHDRLNELFNKAVEIRRVLD